jgi:lipopolysaccharide export LptBFGC system permease protein LptF
LKSFAIKKFLLPKSTQERRNKGKKFKADKQEETRKKRIRKNQLKLSENPEHGRRMEKGKDENFSEFLNNFIMRKFRDHKLRR